MSLQLSIPQPCRQSWEEMRPAATGRYCSRCNKTVIDFTSLSDEEVLAVFQKSTSKVCGRFSASQLQRNIIPQKRHQNSLLPAVMVSSALIISTASGALAQSANFFNPPMSVEKEPYTDSIPQHTTAQPDTLPVIIVGKVSGENKEPLQGTAIRIKGTKSGTVTDENGDFRINIPDHLADKRITLAFEALGCAHRELTLEVPYPEKIDVQMQHSLMGEVYVVRRPNLWQKLKRLFK